MHISLSRPISVLKKNIKRNHGFFGVIALSALFVGLFFITRGITPQSSELTFIEHSSFGQNGGSVVPASCDSGNPLATTYVDTSGREQMSGSHWNGDCVTFCPNGGGSYDPYFDPTASACPSSTPTTPTNPTTTPTPSGGTCGGSIGACDSGTPSSSAHVCTDPYDDSTAACDSRHYTENPGWEWTCSGTYCFIADTPSTTSTTPTPVTPVDGACNTTTTDQVQSSQPAGSLLCSAGSSSGVTPRPVCSVGLYGYPSSCTAGANSLWDCSVSTFNPNNDGGDCDYYDASTAPSQCFDVLPQYCTTDSAQAGWGWSCYGSGGGTSPSCFTYSSPSVCVNGATNYPTCTLPTVDTCGQGSGSTPQNPEPTGTSACAVGTLNASSPTDTSLLWKWSCGTVTTCSAPKYGCTTATDTNYNASGPDNIYGCALTCANGATNYPTCTLCTAPQTLVNGVCTGTTAAAGACSSVHYNCVSPAVSGSNGSTATAYTWTCTGADGVARSCSEAKTLPDLTVGAVSPTGAIPLTAVTLSANVSNIGAASSGAGFTDLFQSASDAAGTGATDIGTFTSTAVPAGSLVAASLSYTFPSAGTYYIRVCADKSSMGNAGVITESNENNNCGNWTAVVASNSAIVASCSVAPSSGYIGDTFRWSVDKVSGGTGLYAYSWSGDEGLSGSGSWVDKAYAATGTKLGSVTITSGDTTDTFACTTSSGGKPLVVSPCFGPGCSGGPGGPGGSGGGCVNPTLCCAPTEGICPAPPAATLLANGETSTIVETGHSAKLTWTSTGATSCSAIGGASWLPPGSSANSSSGISVTPPATTSYQITCIGAGGSANSNTATVNVISPEVSISASPLRVQTGVSPLISWSVVDASGCSITKNGASWKSPISSPGSSYDTVSGQTTYTISSCVDALGNMVPPKSVTVSVVPIYQEF